MILLELVLILVCLCGSAFFSGIETGIVAINRLRLMHRARNGSAAARVIEGFLRQSDRLLGTTLVGNNIVNTVMATLAASLAQARWGREGQVAAGVGVAIAILICGEYLPKAWFSSRPLDRCLPFARTLQVLETILKPLAAFVMRVTQWALPSPGGARRTLFVTREHLHLLTRDSEAGGQISTFERLMIGRVLDLQVKTAAEVMTPIGKVASVRESATLADAVACVRSRGHMKLPVFAEDGSRCIGVLYTQDVLANLLESGAESVTRHMQPPFFLADNVRADDVLPLLRRNRQHLALILRDAGGKVLGIVTVENILKILVGNLPASATGNRKTDPAPAILPSPTP